MGPPRACPDGRTASWEQCGRSDKPGDSRPWLANPGHCNPRRHKWFTLAFLGGSLFALLTVAGADVVGAVIVVDAGRVVARGPHEELVADSSSIFGRRYASWCQQTR